MVRVVVFFVVAALVGTVIRGVVGWRVRAATRRPDVSDADLCQLTQAHRISSVALIASMAGLAIVGLAYAAMRLS